MVLYGDTYFNGSSWAARGSFDANRNGILGRRDDYPSVGKGSILSYCHDRDPICQGRYNWGPTNLIAVDFDLAQHTNYETSGYPEEAARYLAAKVAPLPEPAGPPLDLAFSLDSTGSMWSSLNSVETSMQQIVAAAKIASPDLRVGLVDYKDINQGDPYATRTDIGFTADVPSFTSALNAVIASGGGDIPEAELSGIMASLAQPWRPGVRKEVIVLTDAPGKNPEPVTGYTVDSVVAAAFAVDPAVIDVVVVGGSTTAASFQSPLTSRTGGQTITTSDPAAAADAIVQAIKATGKSPFAFITPIDAAPAGVSFRLSAATSFDPLGRPLTYQWDLDGNGTYEATSDGPVLQTTFATTGDKAVAVKVTNDTGQSGYGSLTVHVIDPGAFTGAPQAPTNVAAAAASDSSTLTWSAPPSGPPAESYVVRTIDGTIVAAVDHGGTGSFTLPGSLLPADVRVTAVNRLGEGGTSAPVHMTATTSMTFIGFYARVGDWNDVYVGDLVDGLSSPINLTFSFQLKNAAGQVVSDLSQVSGSAWDTTEITPQAPTFNAATQRFEIKTFTWKGWGGKEKKFTVTLADGSKREIIVSFDVV